MSHTKTISQRGTWNFKTLQPFLLMDDTAHQNAGIGCSAIPLQECRAQSQCRVWKVSLRSFMHHAKNLSDLQAIELASIDEAFACT